MWQQGNEQSTALRGLDFVDGYYNNGDLVKTPHPVSYFIYGGSGSAYYGPDNSSDALTLSNIWTSETNDVNAWKKAQQVDASWAAAFGLKRTAYEGGASMDDTGSGGAVKEQAWNDSRMKSLVITHQTFWEEMGGDELFYFQLGGNDGGNYWQWNLVRNLFDPVATSPKFQAISELAPGGKSVPTLGTPAPATVDGNSWSVIPRDWGQTADGGSLTLAANAKNEIRWASYNFTTQTSGARRVTVNTSGSGTLEVYLNDTLLDRIAVSGSGSHSSTTLTVGADLHGVRLSCRSGSVTVESVTFK
jgi:hypothetical protein